MHASGPHQRGGVIQRRRSQIHRVLVHSQQVVLQHANARQAGIVYFNAGQGSLDSLGPAGGARRIQHHLALGQPGQRLIGHVRNGILVRLKAVGSAVDHQPMPAVGDEVEHLASGVGHGRGSDQHVRAAVVHQISRLFGRKVPVDGGEVEPRGHRRPKCLVVARMVLSHYRDVVALPQAPAVEQLG